jgi:hypothetical protein
MSNPSRTTPWGAYKEWSRSVPVRVAMVLIVGVAAARSMNSALAGLGIAVLMAMSQMIGYKVQNARQRRREAREHIAGLSRW